MTNLTRRPRGLRFCLEFADEVLEVVPLAERLVRGSRLEGVQIAIPTTNGDPPRVHPPLGTRTAPRLATRRAHRQTNLGLMMRRPPRSALFPCTSLFRSIN